jgi:UDP:flavonoid glycosyltransferase YjiC (YdhE family)
VCIPILGVFHQNFDNASSAGIPQIILPAWHDTYEFAVRVEYLGIGIYGSKKSKSAPEADGAELGSALIAVTEDSEQSRAMKAKAKKLAEVCNKYGGRAKAADKILEKCISKGNEKQP